MAATIVKNFTKVALGVGAVYVTVKQGVWGSSNQGANTFEKVKSLVIPETTSVKIPSASDVKNTCLKKWNSGVQKVFFGVEHIPDYVKNAYDRVFDEKK